MAIYYQTDIDSGISDLNLDKRKHPIQIEADFADAIHRLSNRNYLSVKQFSQTYPSFTDPSLRNLIFKAEPRMSINGMVPGNGLIECGAIVRIGRKVLINEEKFFSWIESQQKLGGV